MIALAALEGLDLAHLDARVHLVWAVLLLCGVAWWASRRRSVALRTFGVDPQTAASVAARRALSVALYAAGLTALVFAALGPRAACELCGWALRSTPG